MNLFLILVIYALVLVLVILCNYFLYYTYYKEPLELMHRRRKSWLLRQKASKEFKLWILQNKEYVNPKKEEDRKTSIKKLQIDIVEIINELNNIENYIDTEKEFISEWKEVEGCEVEDEESL